MTAERKFLFERSFDPPDEKSEDQSEETAEEEEEEEAAPTYSEEELALAREESFHAGKEEGVRDASDTVESQTLDTMRALGIQIPELFRHMERRHSETFHESINAAITIVRKFFPNMTDEHNLKEIETMLGAILSEILEEPRVILHVSPIIAKRLTERVDAIASDAHFEGRVVVMEDEGAAPGDCRVEWSNGGAERNLNDLWRQIDEVVQGNLSASDLQISGGPSEAGDEASEVPTAIDAETADVQDNVAALEPTNVPHDDEMTESAPEIVTNPEPEMPQSAPMPPETALEPEDMPTQEMERLGEPPVPSQTEDEEGENLLESTPEEEPGPIDREPPVPSEADGEEESTDESLTEVEGDNTAPETDGMEPAGGDGILEPEDETN